MKAGFRRGLARNYNKNKERFRGFKRQAKPGFFIENMKVMLGKKVGMSQTFSQDGTVIPVTVIEAGPVFITQIKTKEQDGYEAVQLGFSRAKRIKQAQKGHSKKASLKEVPRWLREFKVGRLDEEKKALQVGTRLDVSQFSVGDKVTIAGVSKAKGFQGVMKRHGFAGGPASHGQKHSAREPGSIGATGPQRVLKGTKMAGRMGGERITVKKLEVIRIDPKLNLLAVKGAVPGPKGQLLEIKG